MLSVASDTLEALDSLGMPSGGIFLFGGTSGLDAFLATLGMPSDGIFLFGGTSGLGAFSATLGMPSGTKSTRLSVFELLILFILSSWDDLVCNDSLDLCLISSTSLVSWLVSSVILCICSVSFSCNFLTALSTLPIARSICLIISSYLAYCSLEIFWLIFFSILTL